MNEKFQDWVQEKYRNDINFIFDGYEEWEEIPKHILIGSMEEYIYEVDNTFVGLGSDNNLSNLDSTERRNIDFIDVRYKELERYIKRMK